MAKRMAKVRITGLTIPLIQEPGKIAISMEKENINGPMGPPIKVDGPIINRRDSAHILGQMEGNMWEITLMTKNMDKEFTRGQLGKSMMVGGKRGSSTGKGQ